MVTETETTENLETQATNGVEEKGQDDYQVISDTRVPLRGVQVKKMPKPIVKYITRDLEKSQGVEITFVVPEISDDDLKRLERCALYEHTVDLNVWMVQGELPKTIQAGEQIPIPEYAYENPDQKPAENWEYLHPGGDSRPLPDSTDQENAAAWENAQELSGFKVGEEVVLEGGELGVIQAIDGHRLQIIGAGGQGTMSLLYPGQVQHKPVGETTGSKNGKGKRSGKNAQQEATEPAESPA